MQQFLADVQSPSWWAGVVIVGIVINVVSAYLKAPIDAALARHSSWWRNRSESSIRRRAELLELLRASPGKQLLAMSKINGRRILATLEIVVAGVCVTVTFSDKAGEVGLHVPVLVVTLRVLSWVGVFLALNNLRWAWTREEMLDELNPELK